MSFQGTTRTDPDGRIRFLSRMITLHASDAETFEFRNQAVGLCGL